MIQLDAYAHMTQAVVGTPEHESALHTDPLLRSFPPAPVLGEVVEESGKACLDQIGTEEHARLGGQTLIVYFGQEGPEHSATGVFLAGRFAGQDEAAILASDCDRVRLHRSQA